MNEFSKFNVYFVANVDGVVVRYTFFIFPA